MGGSAVGGIPGIYNLEVRNKRPHRHTSLQGVLTMFPKTCPRRKLQAGQAGINPKGVRTQWIWNHAAGKAPCLGPRALQRIIWLLQAV